MTEQELTSLCAEWQKTLRLQDWKILVQIKRTHDMPEGLEGCIETTRTKKDAVIRILDPADYPPKAAWVQDMEATLVHELLHLHFPEVDENEYHTWVEQGIELTARALVDLKRKAGQQSTSVFVLGS
jgi:hypothetical protein